MRHLLSNGIGHIENARRGNMGDRELDALIAEKVMGFTDIRQIGMIENSLVGMDPEGISRHTGVPYYSTDISAAWLVEEKMRANGWRFVIVGVPEGIAASFRKGDSFTGEEPFQESAAMAISIAALKALGHGGGE